MGVYGMNRLEIKGKAVVCPRSSQVNFEPKVRVVKLAYTTNERGSMAGQAEIRYLDIFSRYLIDNICLNFRFSKKKNNLILILGASV
jgi:hypothetical protein